MLVLTRDDVFRLLEIDEAIQAMRAAFAAYTSKQAKMPIRQSVEIGVGGTLLCMPSLITSIPSAVVKLVTVIPENASLGKPTVQAVVVYFDERTGEPLALLEGSSLTALRTGATGGLAAVHLGRRDSRVATVFGAGAQGRTQLEALVSVLPIEKAYVVSRTTSKAEEFARDMSAKLDLPVQTSEPRKGVEAADIICTATTSSTPVFASAWVKQGTHVNAVGSFTPSSREVDGSLVQRAKIVVDSLEAARVEAGDIILAVAEGVFSWSQVHAELGELVIGVKPGRETDSEITLFKSVGLGIQDAAIAHLAYAKSRKTGIGNEIEI